MIDPKELRINNIIGWRLGTGTLVIGKACGIEIDRIAISEKRVYVDEEGLGNESQGFIKINGIEPIPLSEEWLKRMGFIKESFSDQYRLGPRLLIKRKHGFYDYGSNVLLKHVHRLQNFWYELEGSELTINL